MKGGGTSRGLPFHKMHGLGNDYVLLDGFELARPDDLARLAPRILDRRRGIGGDGLLWVGPVEGADARMEIYNADGSRAEMCGNGIRCVGLFLAHRRVGGAGEPVPCGRDALRRPVPPRGKGAWQPPGLGPRGQTRPRALVFAVRTDAGRRLVEVLPAAPGERSFRENEGFVRVDMGRPRWSSPDLPSGPAETPFVDRPLPVDATVVHASGFSPGEALLATAVSMGNPHCVVFVPNVDRVNLEEAGPAIEHLELFPHGVNVSFVDLQGPRGTIRQRTWERGVGETRACGTGACAAFAAASRTGRASGRVSIRLRGGALHVERDDQGRIWMSGEAISVGEGLWYGVVS